MGIWLKNSCVRVCMTIKRVFLLDKKIIQGGTILRKI